MHEYTPDVWVILEFDAPSLEKPMHKVFGGWYGGFAGSDSWKLNSGITQVRRDGDWYEFDGYSGSTYRCNDHNYHMSGLMHGILAQWQKQADERGDITIKILSLDEVAKLEFLSPWWLKVLGVASGIVLIFASKLRALAALLLASGEETKS